MKKSLFLLFITCCAVTWAEADDVLPLKKGKGGYVDPTVKQLKEPSKPVVEEEKPEAKKEAEPYVASVGVFGTTKLNEESLRKFLGKDLDKWLKLGIKGDPSSVQMEEKLAKKVKDKYGFAESKWSVIQFFEPGNLAIHIVLDVLETEEVPKRAAFLTAPTQEFKDPDGLLKTWSEYENTALDMIEAGQLEPETDRCEGVSFHCPFGHKNEKLKKYEKVFVDGVKRHFSTLADILNKDKREDYRAAAAYLLAYHRDGQKVVQWMIERIKDPSDLVRNNSLRVLGDLAEFHPQYVIPTTPIIEALNYPRATDRSKSVFVAHLLTLNSQSARDEILKSGVPNVLRLLASSMPDQREFAHGILRKISGKEFGPQELNAWNQWYAKLPKDRGVSGGK